MNRKKNNPTTEHFAARLQSSEWNKMLGDRVEAAHTVMRRRRRILFAASSLLFASALALSLIAWNEASTNANIYAMIEQATGMGFEGQLFE